MDIVDTHCHIITDDVTRYPRGPIGGTQSGWATTRPVTADGMIERMDEAGIGQAVLVQATTAYGYDNSYVLDSRAQRPDRFIAVGTVDPLRPDAADNLAAVAGNGGLAGVRLFTSGSTVPTQGEWFAAPETYPFWDKATELGVTVCLQMRLGPATEQVHQLLRRFPSVRVLLDHMGYPDIAASPTDAGEQVAKLAIHPGLHLKLTHRNLERLHDVGAKASGFLDPVLAAFGANRIAWGSNLPAAEQSLPELVALAQEVLADVPEPERREIFAGTARRLYPSLTA
ncbi:MULTISPECIES: amidohydrolase family protein [Rhodococcus]|uniref:amidohydrolase family protein n=1 Tax=Rhodococcus TaxID=1827 RepID=UPI000EA9DE69|nr:MULTISPECIES: amidohydrolase family protein [Rhodococcus]MDI9939944.1 amidohydrolase family protein [Rhodococcus sp. IEGM 1351]NHU46751.1 amidohydrolase [Rhodococcus sp. A14]QZS53247.1 amidohydrolase [Rhodococcus opacus]RKM73671.1 amidohydrolase [Rhodococcus opacus]